eukprot:scaffold10482_cov56-Attheya_sp.AAC.5
MVPMIYHTILSLSYWYWSSSKCHVQATKYFELLYSSNAVSEFAQSKRKTRSAIGFRQHRFFQPTLKSNSSTPLLRRN